MASAGSILGSGVGGIAVGISLAVCFFFYKKKKNAGDCSQSAARRSTNPARNRAQPRRHTTLEPTPNQNSDAIVIIKTGSSDAHNQLYAAPSPTQPAIYDETQAPYASLTQPAIYNGTQHIKAQVYQNVANEKDTFYDGSCAIDFGDDSGDADL
jgi:hypothetical protein